MLHILRQRLNGHPQPYFDVPAGVRLLHQRSLVAVGLAELEREEDDRKTAMPEMNEPIVARSLSDMDGAPSNKSAPSTTQV